MINIKENHLNDFIFYSVRYATFCKSKYVVADVSALVSRYLNAIPEKERAMLKEYIKSHDSSPEWAETLRNL